MSFLTDLIDAGSGKLKVAQDSIRVRNCIADCNFCWVFLIFSVLHGKIFPGTSLTRFWGVLVVYPPRNVGSLSRLTTVSSERLWPWMRYEAWNHDTCTFVCAMFLIRFQKGLASHPYTAWRTSVDDVVPSKIPYQLAMCMYPKSLVQALSSPRLCHSLDNFFERIFFSLVPWNTFHTIHSSGLPLFGAGKWIYHQNPRTQWREKTPFLEALWSNSPQWPAKSFK